MGELIKFPIQKELDKQLEYERLQNRLSEIEVENKYISDDMDYLKTALENNKEEASDILKGFAIINGTADAAFNKNQLHFEAIDELSPAEEEELDYPVANWDEVVKSTKKLEVDALELLQQTLNALKTTTDDKPEDK